MSAASVNGSGSTGTASRRDPGSFRDSSGVVFERDGVAFRQINPVYLPRYRRLMESGLYRALTGAGLLIPHEEAGDCETPAGTGLILRPAQIPFISYPYEWCFEQYRDAALTTLRAQALAMDYGMILKDASAYNMQFYRGRAVLIDTLSFEEYSGGTWPAYGQFCRHFFAPLALMAHLDVRLGRLMQDYIDGVPLDLADTFLRGKGGFAAWQHIRLHAASIRRFGGAGSETHGEVRKITLTKETLAAITASLIRSVERLRPREKITEWGDYYAATNYSDEAAGEKTAIVDAFLERACGGVNSGAITSVWDLGANDGRYSRLALKRGAQVVAFDIDPVAVSRNYLAVKKGGSAMENMLPLLLDLTAPSPAIGFANQERKTITGRRRPDVTLMLAVIHHLVISNNVPFEMIAPWLASFTKFLIIEFVPKTDSQVRRLLKTRVDIFGDYTEACFERAFSECFELLEKRCIAHSERTLYLFRAR